MLHRTLDAGKPLLCICRGLQLLNVALGGSLIQHIPDALPNGITHRQEPSGPVQHTVTVDGTSRLAATMGQTEVEIASWHHQAIDRLAPGLNVVGRAADGIIEAVEMRDHPNVMAVQ